MSERPSALIADDEPELALGLASRLTALWPALEICCVAGNGIEAAAAAATHAPDFAFLDIHMPGLTGLQVASALDRSHVVFVTAFDEYAVAAFEACAVDYLLKPVSDSRLLACIHRLQRQSTTRQTSLARVLEAAQPPSPSYLVWLSTGLGDTTTLVPVADVLYFQACDKYTEVVTRFDRHLIRTPLRVLMTQLDPRQFAQIHRGCIVALGAVRSIERDLLGRQRVTLRDTGTELALSRSYAAQFRPM
ncbi:LytR/AlgR family response regulator transcription factor [Chitinibacteraceae bacterium HSL-7]